MENETEWYRRTPVGPNIQNKLGIEVIYDRFNEFIHKNDLPSVFQALGVNTRLSALFVPCECPYEDDGEYCHGFENMYAVCDEKGDQIDGRIICGECDLEY